MDENIESNNESSFETSKTTSRLREFFDENIKQHIATKKWKEYIIQFIMIFLAVTLSFIAENIRETQIEKEQERQFMQSLNNDIKADIENLNFLLHNRFLRQTSLDSVTMLLNSPRYRESSGSIYHNAIHLARRMHIRFTPNNGTLEQLKNAGNLRLVRKSVVVDRITAYDVSTRNLSTFMEIEDIIVEDYRTTSYKIFNSLVFENMIIDNDNNAIRPVNNPKLLSFDKKELNEVNFKLLSMKLYNRGTMRDTKELLAQAINLKNILEKSYKLE